MNTELAVWSTEIIIGKEATITIQYYSEGPDDTFILKLKQNGDERELKIPIKQDQARQTFRDFMKF